MKEENRWASQADIVSEIMGIMSLFSPDDKGAHLRFINKSSAGLDNLKGDALKAQMNFVPDGSTKIGTNLNSKILQPFIYSITDAGAAFDRPVLVIIITDGWPTEEPVDTLQNAIITCQQRLQAAHHPRDGKPITIYAYCLVSNTKISQLFYSQPTRSAVHHKLPNS